MTSMTCSETPSQLEILIETFKLLSLVVPDGVPQPAACPRPTIPVAHRSREVDHP